MPESSADRDDALARHLAGESSPEEAAALEEWLTRHPQEAATFRLVRDAASRLSRATPPVDLERAWQRTAARLHDPDAAASRPAHARWRNLLAVAAALLLAVLGGLWTWQRAGRAPALAYSAPPGVPQVIPFEGGRMVLAPRSRLVARHQAGMRPAEVRLEGEAWFEIAHDPRHPFTVKAGDAEITDLGTVFSVRGHAGSPVEVEVLEGSVELRSAAGQRLVIEGGSAGRVEGGAITRSALAGMARPAWIDGRLEFADATLAEVRAELRRWYGLDLRLGDSSLASRHVTASFQGEPVARVLQVIALALGASVEQRGDTAILRLTGDPAAQ